MDQKPKKQLNKYIRLTGIGLQMGITIYLFAYLGKWLDAKYLNDEQLYTKILTFAGVMIALYSMYRQVKNLNI